MLAEGLTDQASFGGIHTDDGDLPFLLSCMVISSDLPDDYDPGRFRSEFELRELLIGCLVAAPVFRSELELRELLIGIYRSIPRTAPPCFQYTELPLLGRFPPLLPFRALGVNSGFRLKPLSSVSFNAKSNLMVTMSF